jgi:nucleoside-diphosphate-sugar epimerase
LFTLKGDEVTGRPMKRILVTGSVGQIGSELVMELRERYGNENVVGTFHRTLPSDELTSSGPMEKVRIQDFDEVSRLVEGHDIDTIFNMAAILSAVGEQKPQICWDVNMNGFINIMEVARERELRQVINPSSIAAFGPETPLQNTPNDTILKPKTMYGVTKVAGEILGDYYFYKYGLDVRGMRLPGIVSWKTLPGGGTTDYSVAMYYEAVQNRRYTCFVKEDTRLPLMYMPDCLKSMIDLALAPIENLEHHCDFNVTAFSNSAGEIAAAIRAHYADLEVTYEPDFRQAIADSWPDSIDDTAARKEWGWDPEYDLERMTVDMIENLERKLLG